MPSSLPAINVLARFQLYLVLMIAFGLALILLWFGFSKPITAQPWQSLAAFFCAGFVSAFILRHAYIGRSQLGRGLVLLAVAWGAVGYGVSMFGGAVMPVLPSLSSLLIYTFLGVALGVLIAQLFQVTNVWAGSAALSQIVKVAIAWGGLAVGLVTVQVILGRMAPLYVALPDLLIAGVSLIVARLSVQIRGILTPQQPVFALGLIGLVIAALVFSLAQYDAALILLLACAVALGFVVRPWGGMIGLACVAATIVPLVLVAPTLSLQSYLIVLVLLLILHAQQIPFAKESIDYNLPPADVLARHAALSSSWLMSISFADNCISFPFGAGVKYRAGQKYPLDRVVMRTSFAPIQALIAAPQEKLSTDRDLVIKIDGDQGEIDVELRVLARDTSQIWIAALRLDHMIGLADLLERAEIRAAEANQRVDRLLSLASHELRTPVSAISMLVEDMRAGKTWTQVAPNFEPQLERLIRLLEDLRAGSSSKGPGPNRFTLNDLAREVMAEFSAAALARNLRLHISLPDDLEVSYIGDTVRISLALSRIVQNVIKHSEAQNLILVGFVTAGAGGRPVMTLTLADDGIGVAPERQAQLFEPFSGSQDGQNSGFGLGLYTARKVLRAIEGDLVFIPVAKGSCLSMTVPLQNGDEVMLRRAQAPASAVAAMLQEAAVVTVAAGGRGRALLIEDNRLVGEITATRLARLFDHVDWAENGPEGLEKALTEEYDMIFVDQLLPGMNGDKVVREIRKRHPLVPIVGVTASTLGDECQALQDAGASLAMEKPLSYAVMCDVVAEFCPTLAPQSA